MAVSVAVLMSTSKQVGKVNRVAAASYGICRADRFGVSLTVSHADLPPKPSSVVADPSGTAHVVPSIRNA
jgi:hypothetical protein